MDVENLLGGVGSRLRDIRNRRRMTLADVSRSIGFGVSTLSRLESGARKPTLDLLIPLARLYDVALDDIVGAPPTGDPRIRPVPIRRHGRIYIPLTRSGGPVQAFKMILPGTARVSPLRTHDGYEWLYVLSGTLDLQVGDVHTMVAAGEAAEFDTRVAHGMTSADGNLVEVLSLFSAQGERIHINGG